MSVRRLFAGPWPGELGVFLAWSAGVRRIVAETGPWDEVLMAAPPGWEPLVADFVDRYIPIKRKGTAVGYREIDATEARRAELAAMVPASCFHVPAVDTLPEDRNAFREPIGDRLKWVRLGRRRARAKRWVLLHARCRDWGADRNWPLDQWMALAERLGGELASIGSKGGAWHIPGTQDLRGIPMRRLLNILANAEMLISPSSGPAHIAALCGCPHVVWFGSTATPMPMLLERYKAAWNPFGTPVAIIEEPTWRPSVAMVLVAAHALRSRASARGNMYRDAVTIYRCGNPRPAEVGLAILVYERLDLAKRAILGACRHTTMRCQTWIWDNSREPHLAAWLQKEGVSCYYVRGDWRKAITTPYAYFDPRVEPHNWGCTVPRNVIARHMRAQGCKWMVWIDGDVEPLTQGWIADMLRVAEQKPQAGCVAWPLSNLPLTRIPQNTPRYEPDADGRVPEVPGLCNLYPLDLLAEVPWQEGFFVHGFDSLHCLDLWLAGRPVHLVPGTGSKIAHRHPHSGMDCLRHLERHRAFSRRLMRAELARRGVSHLWRNGRAAGWPREFHALLKEAEPCVAT